MHGATHGTTRNHTARVEDLTRLHDDGLITYLEAGRDSRGTRTYTFAAAGEKFTVGAKSIDAWLEGFRIRECVRQCGGHDSNEGAAPGQPPAEPREDSTTGTIY
jgi:hypothetical protein